MGPITDDQKKLSVPNHPRAYSTYAVLCCALWTAATTSIAVAMELDDGGLGFVAALDSCMYMWSWQADANNGIGSWAQHMVLTELELETLLPRGNPWCWHEVTGWVEGTHTIFISIDTGVFTLDLKSKKVKKVGKMPAYYRIIPYMTFYTPGTTLCALFLTSACTS